MLRRLALVAAATAGLVSCVGVDTPEPGAGRRAEPRAGDRLEGRVDGRRLIGRVGAVPYAQAPRRSVPAMASPPAEAGAADCPPAEADPLGVHDRRCYGADPQAADGMAGDDIQPDIQPVALSDAGLSPAAADAPDAAAGGRMVIPPEGVNIDAELGVAGAGDNPLGVGEAAPQPAAPVAAQILVPQGPMAIAEGQTSQPVVDGIGTDNPTALPSGAAQPSTLSL
ncbi:MAG: hypothetical protein ACK4PN_12905 [Allorhizobium sp.]